MTLKWHFMFFVEMPLGVMPVLEYDGEVLSQSKTIARFLAKEFGVAGKTNIEQAKADMIVDCVTDIEIGKVLQTTYLA